MLEILADDDLFDALKLDSFDDLGEAVKSMLGGMKTEDLIKNMLTLGCGVDEIREAFIDLGLGGDEALKKLTNGSFEAIKYTDKLKEGFSGLVDLIKVKFGDLTSKLSGFISKISAFVSANSALLIGIGATVGILYSTYKMIEVQSFDYMSAKALEASEALAQTNNELKSMESELETNAARIKELNSLETPTAVEKEELATLERKNQLLAAQIELLRLQQEKQEKESSDSAYAALTSDQHGSGTIIDYFEKGKENLESFEKQYDELAEKVKTMRLRGETDTWEYKNAVADLEKLSGNIDFYESYLSDKKVEILAMYQSLFDLDGNIINEDHQWLADYIESLFDLDFSSIKNTFRNNLINSGISETIADVLGNEFNDWFDNLSDDQKELVYSISCETDTATWNLHEWQNALVEAEQKASRYIDLSNSVGAVINAQSAVFSNNSYIAEDVYNSIAELAGGEEELADCIDTTNGFLVTNAEKLNALVDASKETVKNNIELATSHERLNYHDLTRQLKDVVSEMDEYDEASITIVQNLLDQIDATALQISKYEQLEKQLLGTTTAFEKFAKAQETDAATDYTDDLSGMIDGLISAFNNKEFGTEAFWSGFNALIPKDVYSQFTDVGDQIDAGWEYINTKLSRYFTSKDGDNVSIDFDNVKKFVEDGLATAYKGATVFTGTLESFELNDSINSIEEFADAMGITTTAAFALGNAISKYSVDNEDFLSSLSVDSLEGQIYAADQQLVELLAHQAELGKSGQVGTDEWYEVRDAINSANTEIETLAENARKNLATHIEIDTDITNAQQKVDTLNSTLQSIDENSPQYEVTMANYLQAEKELAALLQHKYNLEAPTELTIQVALEQVQNEINTTQSQLNKLATFDGQTYTAVAGVDQTEVDSLVTKIESLKGEMSTIQAYCGINDEEVLSSLETVQNYVINDKEFEVTAKLGDTLSRLQQVINKLNSINSKAVDVSVNTTYSYNGAKPARAYGTAHARGNWGLKSSDKNALVGELGQELVVDPQSGTYRTVGDNGAEFVDLPRGAIIFNHRQTESLLKNKRINSRGKAYVQGNAYLGLYDKDNGSPGSSGSSASKNSGVFDWIEVAIDRISEAIDKLTKTASSAYKSLKTKLGAAADAIVLVNEKIRVQQAAYERYLQEAESIDLSDELKQKVQTGEIDLAEYDSDTQDLIKEYQDLYEKSTEAKDAIADLHEELAGLYKERFDNIQENYNNQLEDQEHLIALYESELGDHKNIDPSGVYDGLREAQTETIDILNKELKELEIAFADAMSSGLIEEGSDAWYEMRSDIHKVNEELIDARENLANLAMEEFEGIQDGFDNQTDVLDHAAEQIENEIELLEAKGQSANAEYYDALQSLEQQRIGMLKQELSDLEKALEEGVASGDIEVGGNDWYEMQSSIADVKEEIQEANISLEEYNQTMRDLEWEAFDKQQEAISDAIDTNNYRLDLLDHEDHVDDDGNITSAGYDTANLHLDNYNAYIKKANAYAAEIKKIDAELASNPNDEILLERRKELLELQRDSISAAVDERQTIKDLNEEAEELRIEAMQEALEEQAKATKEALEEQADAAVEALENQMNSMKELIDSYKDALDSAKDLYDYQRKISDQTDKIGDIEKQLSAYKGDDSEETRAKVQQLKESLNIAKDDLEEMEYSKYISDQKALLDDIYSQYELNINGRIDEIKSELEEATNRIDTDLETAISSLDVGTDLVIGSILSEADGLGSTLSGEIQSATGELSGGIQSSIDGSASGIQSSIDSASGELSNSIQSSIDGSSNGIQSSINGSANGIQSSIDGVTGAVDNRLASTNDTLKDILDATKNILKKAENETHDTEVSKETLNQGTPTVPQSNSTAPDTTVPSNNVPSNVPNIPQIDPPSSTPSSITDNQPNTCTHVYEEEVVKPTTKEKGFTLHTCKKCGHSYKDNWKNKLSASTSTHTPLALNGGIAKHKHMVKYASGGLADYTGLAWLDGTPGKPEMVLNPTDTENFIELKDILRTLADQPLTFANNQNTYKVDRVVHTGLMDTAQMVKQMVSQNPNNNIQQSVGDINIDVHIDHVQDYNDFANQLRNDKKFEEMIQDITLNRLNGGSKLAKNKHIW